MFILRQLNDWVADIRAQISLPLRLLLWDGTQIDFSQAPPRVIVRLPCVSAARHLLVPSLCGLGTAYVEGVIEIQGAARDMIAVVNALARTTLKPEGRFARVAHSVIHSRKADAEAVRYHYDVSNAFYQQFLDAELVYSCAYFENGNEDLATAQMKKIDLILHKIGLRQHHTLLDIGCGWGALVIRAAQCFGVRCVGVTLSMNQFDHARERVQQAGLSHLVDIRLMDYREVRGQFDRITSVGMFEHVGLLHLREYFSTINRLLAPDGVVMNHGITTTDPENGEAPYGGGAFISKYVFPHGELAHLGYILKTMQEAGLEVSDVENLRRHYARTCAIWSDNLEANSEQVRALGGEQRYRIWQVYLAGCSYAFEQDWISVFQIVCNKAGCAAAVLPWSRQRQVAATGSRVQTMTGARRGVRGRCQAGSNS